MWSFSCQALATTLLKHHPNYICAYRFIFTTATLQEPTRNGEKHNQLKISATKALAECNGGFNHLHFTSVVALTNLIMLCDIFPLLNQSPSTSSFWEYLPDTKPPFYGSTCIQIRSPDMVLSTPRTGVQFHPLPFPWIHHFPRLWACLGRWMS